MAIDLNDPEVIAAIEAETAKISAKNKQLLGELRTAKAKAAGAADIDPEDYARMQGEVESLTERLTKSEKTAKTQVETLTKDLAARESSLTNHLVDAGIAEALAKAGVGPHYVGPLKAMFKGQASLKNENGQYSALIGDKALADHINSYLAGDEGKHFVTAPGAAGGGSNQSGAGKPSAGAQKRSAMSVPEKAAYISAHGQDAYFKLPA